MFIRKSKAISLVLIMAAALVLTGYKSAADKQAVQEPFSKDYWEKIKNKTDYTEKPLKERNVDDGFIRRVPAELPELVQIALVSAVILLLAFIILRLVLNFSGQTGKIKKTKLLINTVDDEFSSNDLLYGRFADARAGGDYPLALRYLYLILLQHFASLKLIELKRGKTNMQYCHELGRNSNDYSLDEITGEFEASWFGDKDLNEDSFTRIVEPYSWLTGNTVKGNTKQ